MTPEMIVELLKLARENRLVPPTTREGLLREQLVWVQSGAMFQGAPALYWPLTQRIVAWFGWGSGGVRRVIVDPVAGPKDDTDMIGAFDWSKWRRDEEVSHAMAPLEVLAEAARDEGFYVTLPPRRVIR